MWVVLAFVLWQSREAELERAEATVANLARLLDEQTYRVFQTTDLALRAIAGRLERRPPPPRDDPEIRALMHATIAELPHLRALFAIGADGFITHDTDYPDTPRVSLADRSYLIVHRDNPRVGLHVDRPLTSRSVDRWFVPVSRRLENPDGSFAGVVVAAVEPTYFEDFYQELKLGPNDAATLFNLNTILIARVPVAPNTIGQVWPDLVVFKEVRAGAERGSFEVRSFTGVESLLGFSRVSGYPLVAAVTLGISDALAGWKKFAVVSTVSATCITAMVLVLSILTVKRRREREAALKAAYHAQKMEALGRMTGSVAHDFGNVLNVIASSNYLMRKNGATAELLDAGAQAVETGTLLTRQLMSFAKRGELHLRPGDPNELLRSLEPMLKHAAGQGVQVALDLAPGARSCLVDQAQLDAAVMNLVVNAAQAMPEGGKILISTEDRTVRGGGGSAARKLVCVRVTDTGSGIAPENLQRIFEPFFTTKQDHGTGLGLAQVWEFMKRVGGDVTVESTLGAGTTFELLFPCIEGAASAFPAEEPPPTLAQ
jgi:signal transduction histidine kinase